MSFDRRPDPDPLHGKIMADPLTIQIIEGGIKQEEALHKQCNTDSQTGLANRRFWDKYIELLDKRRPTDNKVLIFIIDADDFKGINDTLGHSEGDNAIVHTADILRHTFREEDLIARIGGDEFGIIAMYNDQDPQKLMAILIARLKKNIKEHNILGEAKYKLKLSIGGAYNKDDQQASVKELARIADERMYRKKRNKGSQRK